MAATEPCAPAAVNVSVAIRGGRFSGVDRWPVLGVYRGWVDIIDPDEAGPLNVRTFETSLSRKRCFPFRPASSAPLGSRDCEDEEARKSVSCRQMPECSSLRQSRSR